MGRAHGRGREGAMRAAGPAGAGPMCGAGNQAHGAGNPGPPTLSCRAMGWGARARPRRGRHAAGWRAPGARTTPAPGPWRRPRPRSAASRPPAPPRPPAPRAARVTYLQAAKGVRSDGMAQADTDLPNSFWLSFWMGFLSPSCLELSFRPNVGPSRVQRRRLRSCAAPLTCVAGSTENAVLCAQNHGALGRSAPCRLRPP